MIVRENLLKELFSQLPNVVIGAKSFPVKFHWGGQDDLNLYMREEKNNKHPLIWLVQDRAEQLSTEQSSNIKLIIAKDSAHKTSRNPIVWETEFDTILNPLFENVLKCLKRSGRTMIVGDRYRVYREANYSEPYRDSTGKVDTTKTKTIDHWNVIEFTADINFTESTLCMQQINFNN
jgi:hypothetical protein